MSAESTGNQLLDTVPLEERVRLLVNADRVSLELEDVLFEPGRPTPFVYFPVNGVVSLVQVAQNVACTQLHGIEQRCARWLLSTHDRVHSDVFPLTQEFLGQMLGVGRQSVSMPPACSSVRASSATTAASSR